MCTLRQGDVPASRKREERNRIAPNEIQIIALSDLLDNKEATEEKIVLFLSSFSCRDADVEHFLHKTAILYEKSKKARTYLLTKTEPMPCIFGYFSLALACVEIEKLDSLSKSQRKRLNGLFDPRNAIPCYLIGQLGRNSVIDRITLPGESILEQAIGVIKIAQERVAGRFVLVECAPEPKLIDFYKRNGFHLLSQDDYLCQLYRIID